MNTLKRTSDNPPLLATIGVLLVLAAAAAGAGLLAASANPLMIALGGGAIVGALLLMAPKLTLWLAIVLGLGTGAILSFAGGFASKMQWGIVLLSLMLFVPVLLNILPRPRFPTFIWLFIAFIVVALISSAVHWPGASPLISGLKRYFQALGIMLALVVIPVLWNDVRRLRTTLLWIGLIQLPFVLYEAIVLVPIRAALEASSGEQVGSDVTDVIAGTFGANLGGGSPGAEMAGFVLILMGFAWAYWRARLISTRNVFWFILWMLPCITLGEVKIIVVMFPLLALVLYKGDIVANPGRYLPVMAMVGLCTAALTYLYFGYFSGETVDTGFARMLRYNVEDQGYGNLVLNRTTAVTFWWRQQGLHDPVGLFFGHGLGSSYWTPDRSAVSGFIGAKYPYYGIGLTALSTLLWDVGVVGTALFLCVFLSAFIQSMRLYKKETDPLIRAQLLGLQGALVVFSVFIPHNPSILSVLPYQTVVAVVLGYLGRMLIDPHLFRSMPPSTNDAVRPARH